MRMKLLYILLTCCVVTVGTTKAQTTMDQEMAGLADKIGKALVGKGCKNVAAVDFTDIQGQPTELGRFLSEQLTVEIVATSSVSMVDRTNIRHILAEHNLTVEGLVDPANAKKLGEFAGVDTILVGSVTEVDDGYRLMVKAISTSSAQIIAAGWVTFKKTPAIEEIANRGLPSIGIPGAKEGAAPGDTSSTSYREDKPIAMKDLGSLRVVLKSVLPIKFTDRAGRSVNGIRCTFDFESRETQRTISVAMNANPGDGPQPGAFGSGGGGNGPSCRSGYQGTRLGDILRTTLVDEVGTR